MKNEKKGKRTKWNWLKLMKPLIPQWLCQDDEDILNGEETNLGTTYCEIMQIYNGSVEPSA